MLDLRRKLFHTIAVISILFISLVSVAQAADNSGIPRTADGRADFGGIWQALGSANWNIEPHAADFGPLPQLGAIGAIPGGLGIVEGGEIPYTAAARTQQQSNRADWLALDPVVK